MSSSGSMPTIYKDMRGNVDKETWNASWSMWRDALTDALNLKVSGVGLSLNSTESTVDFDTNAKYNTDFLYCNIQLNHDRDLTSKIYPHIHFFQAENHIPNFLVEYRWQINQGEKVTAWTKYVCNTTVTAYSGTTKNAIAENATGISAPVGTALSDIIQFRIYRDTANDSGSFAGADPYTAVVGVTAFDLHFKILGIGSTLEYIK